MPIQQTIPRVYPTYSSRPMRVSNVSGVRHAVTPVTEDEDWPLRSNFVPGGSIQW